MRLALRSGRLEDLHTIEAHLGDLPFEELQRIIASERLEHEADRHRDEFLFEFAGMLIREIAEGFSWMCSLIRKEFVSPQVFLPKPRKRRTRETPRRSERGGDPPPSKYKGASAAMQTAIFTQHAARARAAAGAED